MNRIVLELPPLPNYVTIGLTHYTAGEQHPNRKNIGIFDWLFVVRGALHIGEDDKQWELAQSQSLLLLPDRYHYSTAPCRMDTLFYWIHFDFQGIYRVSSRTDFSIPIRNAWANPYKLELAQYAASRQFPRIERLLEQMIDHAEAGGTVDYWREQQWFMDLLHYMEDEEQVRSIPTSVLRVAEQTEAYLRQHYQQDLTNKMLAEALHFHSNYIVRCMKEIYRCTPMEYLQKYRLEQAKLLLIKTEWPVAVIAERIGYNYAPYFSSCFKRYSGVSPLSFRMRHTEG